MRTGLLEWLPFVRMFLCLFLYALAFFPKRPRFPTDKIFYYFLFFLSSEAIFTFFLFFITCTSALSFLMRNCYHRPPKEDDVCTNAWQQEEKKPLYTNKNDKKDEKWFYQPMSEWLFSEYFFNTNFHELIKNFLHNTSQPSEWLFSEYFLTRISTN